MNPLETSQRSARSLSLDGVSHAYAELDVVHDVTLDVNAGESLALLGPSGCGKTTLLRLIAGLERARQGTIQIGHHTVCGPNEWIAPDKRRVGMVFQDWALFPHLTVAANVGYGLPRAERKGGRVDQALRLVGLTDLADRMPDTLSGGQQQRIALARALAPEPSLLLLDEPFSNLDTSLRVEVRGEVHRLLHELGITTIVVTHDQEEAFVLGDRVAVMRSGHVVQVGSPQDLYRTPADRDIAEFVGSGSIVRATASGGRASTICGDVAVQAPDGAAPDGDVDVLLRPEQIALTAGTGATVDLVEYYGHDTMVFVRAGESVLRVRSGPEATYVRGDQVGLQFIGTHAVAFPRTSA